jgi:hypothetical protein
LQDLEFNPQNSKPETYDAIIYFQQKAGKIKENDAPLGFIPKKNRKDYFLKTGHLMSACIKLSYLKPYSMGLSPES